MTPLFHIRPAKTTELPLLSTLYRFLHPQDPALAVTTARQSLREAETQPGSTVLVGLRGEFAVTTCMVVVIPSGARSGKPSALIDHIATHPEHRRKGHATSIVFAALAAAWEAGCFKATILGGTDDPALAGLCAATGFEPTKTGFTARPPA